MNEINEKYLARMLEGAEQGLDQIDQAEDQLVKQLDNLVAQRNDMITAVLELKELLGIEDEVSEVTELPFKVVEDEVEEPLTGAEAD